jgi:hypothetical protein
MRVVVEKTADSMTTVERYVEGEPELCIVQQGSTGITQSIVFQTVDAAIKTAMALLEFAGWQPMETAPRDGSLILTEYKEVTE